MNDPKPEGTPAQDLFGAAFGFFIGLATVALFDTTAPRPYLWRKTREGRWYQSGRVSG